MLKEIFNDEIPVLSDSLLSIPSKNSFPEVEMARNSSNSAFTPTAIAFPLAIATGASWFRVVLIFSRNKSQLCKLSPITFTASCGLCKAKVLIGSIASKDSFKYTTSRGDTFPAAIFEINRSKSEICLI